MDNTIKKNIIRLISEAIGSNKILSDNDLMQKYGADETSDLFYMPDIVVKATSTSDVSAVLRICNMHKIPVTTRGAGTGVTGGAVPVNGGVVLSLENMNRILEIDTANMTAIVEPGVITKDLQTAVLEHGLLYPPDPASLDSCSIGGNVAEGAGGPRAVKYGTTKDYVLGLEFVLADGSILNTGGKIVKNATGFNLTGILTGSEGTLAVITKIYLKLIPAPRAAIDLLIPFAGIREALDIVPQFFANKIIPSAIEFIEEDAIRLTAKYLSDCHNVQIPYSDAGAHLIVQIDGNSEDEIMAQVNILNTFIKTNHEIIIANNAALRERIWQARRSIRESIRYKSQVFLAEDTVVPRASIPQFLTAVKAFLKEKNLFSVMFGHAGDGNVHIDILKDDMDYAEWQKIIPVLKENIYKLAVSYGGTITGEHGIGFIRKEYLHIAMLQECIELSKRIKSAFDPNSILNPEKIF